ncbi:MAG: ribosomal subunit interface protein [Flavobacteriales bacterium]|nr:ribosomal subunit interface protein [Flavobacteriales bacterium]|tara:strand:+ start:3285 stop:3584 length:300 start_codon:yes stop_codon:yes gene_type:complete
MKVKVSALHFTADKKLIDFANERVSKLEKFYDKIIDSNIVFRVHNAEDKENKSVEIKLNIPGKELFAKKQSDSFEKSVDEAVEALRRQLKKHKEKLVSA